MKKPSSPKTWNKMETESGPIPAESLHKLPHLKANTSWGMLITLVSPITLPWDRSSTSKPTSKPAIAPCAWKRTGPPKVQRSKLENTTSPKLDVDPPKAQASLPPNPSNPGNVNQSTILIG